GASRGGGGGGVGGGAFERGEVGKSAPHPTRFARRPLPASGARWNARLVRSLASLAEPRERVGGEAAARVDGGDARLHALDPGLGRRARIGRKLAQLGRSTREIAPRGLGLAARDDRVGIAPRR